MQISASRTAHDTRTMSHLFTDTSWLKMYVFTIIEGSKNHCFQKNLFPFFILDLNLE